MDEIAEVPYEGVVSWLLCRRLLPEDYHQRLKGMTAYIREALQQQPPEHPEVAAFLEEKKRGPFGYLEVEKLVQLLAREKATDGLFSKAFGSASYRQWRRLQQTFQQQNLHLADVSRALCSAANGIVPSHQKSLQQKQRLISDCIKRQQQLRETASAALESYQQLCSNYGLHAEAAADPQLQQQQLQVYVHRKLPLRLERAEQLLQQPGADLLSFYRSFIAFSAGSSNREEGQAPLPLLALLSVKGNMSLEEAAAAAPGILVLQQQLQQQQQQEAAKALEIEIQQQGDEGAFEGSKQSHVDEAVCWVVEEGVDDSSNSSSNNSSSSSSSSGSSKGLNVSLLSNGVIRRQLLLELTELKAFLYSRILQSGGASNCSSNRKQQQQQWQQNAFLPQELQKEETTLLGWRESLEELQELLGGAETLQLLQLLQSDRAFNRVLHELLTARALVQKPLSAAKQQKSKQSALEGEVTAAAAALEKQRRELQELHRLLQDRMTAAVGRKWSSAQRILSSLRA
ncbi:hypothetical protein Esti_005966 [Eimeria stiedai]